MTDPRAYLADVLAKAEFPRESASVEASKRWPQPSTPIPNDKMTASQWVDDGMHSGFVLGAMWATSPAMARALIAVLDECDQLRFKGKGEPDDMPDEDDMVADRIATRIHQAITTELAKEIEHG